MQAKDIKRILIALLFMAIGFLCMAFAFTTKMQIGEVLFYLGLALLLLPLPIVALLMLVDMIRK